MGTKKMRIEFKCELSFIKQHKELEEKLSENVSNVICSVSNERVWNSSNDDDYADFFNVEIPLEGDLIELVVLVLLDYSEIHMWDMHMNREK